LQPRLVDKPEGVVEDGREARDFPEPDTDRVALFEERRADILAEERKLIGVHTDHVHVEGRLLRVALLDLMLLSV